MILESRAAGPGGPRAMTPTLILPASQPGFGGQLAKLEPEAVAFRSCQCQCHGQGQAVPQTKRA